MVQLSEDEHIARAMLLGMHYHGGNGSPFYYAKNADGTPNFASFVDANTLQPMINYETSPTIDWKGIGRKMRAKQELGIIPWLK